MQSSRNVHRSYSYIRTHSEFADDKEDLLPFDIHCFGYFV